MEKKLQKAYFTNYNLLTAQELWQACYQILFIILLKEFMKLKTSMVTIIKNAERLELNVNIVSAALNTQTINMI